MAFEQIEAAQADVVYRTNLGVFKAEQAEVQAVYGRTTATMSTEALKLASAQEKLNRAIAMSGPESKAAADATIALRTRQDELAKSELAAAAASRRAAEQRLAAYAGAARTVGSTLTRFVTVPTALLTAAAVKMGIDFQQQMLLIQTQAGASAAEVHKLSGEVLALAKTTPQGPAELAKGLYHLESLGLRGAKAMSTLRISALAAGMGIADLESTATALGAVVVTGIQGAQDYQHAMGLLVGTVGAGNVRMEDLATSIGNVAPAAAAAGVSLTELGAAYATLTDRGFSADEAATRLRMALSLIQSPSEKARKALADMGVDADKLGGLLREPNGLLKVLETLHDAVKRVGDVRGNRDLLAGFGGGRSGLGIQTLVQSLDSSVSSYRQKLQQVDAQSKKFAANQQAYLHSEAYQLHAALSTIESDLTSAGGKIAPVFVGAAKAVSLLVDAFSKLPSTAKLEIGAIIGLLAVGGPLLLGIAAVIRAVQTIGKAFQRLPVQAGPGIAETEAELATLRTTAIETSAVVSRVGPYVGSNIAGGVGAGVARAETKIGLLRKSLLGLGALTIAPIVIPIIYHIAEKFFPGSSSNLHDAKGETFDVAGVTLHTYKGTAEAKYITEAKRHKISRRDAQAFASALLAGDYGNLSGHQVDEVLHALGLDLLIDPHTAERIAGGAAEKQRVAAQRRARERRRHPKFTTAIPTSLQLAVAQAQYRKDVPAEKKALEEEKAFLERELRLAKTEKQRLAAIQALQAVQDQIDSLDTKTADGAKRSADKRQRAYQKRLDADERRLKLNLARAKLAETRAGDNKKALERALAAERKSLNAEIDFYRKEAHDKQLAAKERQHYAALEIAAEKAKAEVNKKLKNAKDAAAKATKSELKQQEADFLSQLRDVFLTYAGNVFEPASTRPTVTVNQSFPAPPTDQHRQARLARSAMRAAFDG